VLFDSSATLGAIPVGEAPGASSRGVYVWRSALGVVACGPTAEPVEERATPPSATCAVVRAGLREAAVRAVPGLQRSSLVGTYAGLRPGSDASHDYLIEVVEDAGHCGPAWLTVGGIRSTGLTASLGIARHVSRLCDSAIPDRASRTRLDNSADVLTTPLPSLAELVASFRTRGDGTLTFGRDDDGFGSHLVTHPLTRLGLERMAADKEPP